MMRTMMGPVLLAALALAVPAGPAVAQADAAEKPVRLRTIPVTLMAGGRAHRVKAELAATGAEQARGLMYRDHLAPDAGMLFPMTPPRVAGFWMKNTRIPLDLIFIRADGTIARIAERATPYSLAVIDSGEPVAAVLELAGGRAAALGLKPGDRVTWPAS